MLTGGCASDNKAGDFLSASRSNNDLKEMLKSANEQNTEKQAALQGGVATAAMTTESI